ncbi:MFS transporter [Streptomyces fuscichromogenes]|uniref:MFS transporter n=1 Tax=Streptomyces fuscichromogenes TaxID=1324013 RepID=UPI0038196A0E
MRRDLSLYWWGQTTTAFGSVFTAIAVPVVAVVQLGASPGWLGVITAAGIVPVLLLGLPGGALADRITRPRRTLVALDVVSAVAVGTVALGLTTDMVTIGWLVALGVVQGGLSVLAGSLYFVHLTELVGKDGIGRARARLQAGQYGASLVGRSLAGPAVALFGGQAALGVDAVSFALSALALRAMHSPDHARRTAGPTPSAGLPTGVVGGLRFLFAHPYHRALLTFVLSSAVGLTGMNALTGPFLLLGLGLPTEAYGLVFALSGAMGLAGSAVAGRILGPDRDSHRITVIAFAAGMVCTLLLPLATGPLVLAGLCAALGIGLPVLFGAIANVALSAAVVADIPEHLLGRAMAGLQVLMAAAGVVGALTGGALGDWVGVRPALWLLALVMLTATVLAAPLALRAALRQATTVAAADETLDPA